MKYLILFVFFATLLSACDKRKDYKCTCDEYFNPNAQRNFGFYVYENKLDKEARELCFSNESELNEIYRDSVMWDNASKNSKSPVKEIKCSHMPTN